jgi:hypothetical protein
MQELDTRLRNWSRHLVSTATINLSTVLESPYRREYSPERRKGISEFIHRLQAFTAKYPKHRFRLFTKDEPHAFCGPDLSSVLSAQWILEACPGNCGVERRKNSKTVSPRMSMNFHQNPH